MNQSDPGVAGISKADLQNFLDTTFSGLFGDAAWSGTWSSASDQNMRSRISASQTVDTSTNANQQAFRKLASAYTMVADLGVDGLNDDAFQAVADKAAKLVGEAIQDLTQQRAILGITQKQVADANDAMKAQTSILNQHIVSLEAVDPAEASTRLSALMTQIETSYAMTARIQQLSLLKYLT